MEANDNNDGEENAIDMALQEPMADGAARTNDRIVARVQELLRLRQGTIFESPDGSCLVIQLRDPLSGRLRDHNGGVAAESSSMEMCGKPQPQDSQKEMLTAGAQIEDVSADCPRQRHHEGLPEGQLQRFCRGALLAGVGSSKVSSSRMGWHSDVEIPKSSEMNAADASDEPSELEPAGSSAWSGSPFLKGKAAGPIAASESQMSLASDVSSPEEPLAEASADSSELNESYDPIKEFEELLDVRGLRAPLTKKELLWRKAMYCRYRCHLINLDLSATQNTWAEVARFVGWSDWKELRTYSIRKFLQLPGVDDVGTRDIFDVAAYANKLARSSA
jgi:hypothetical protein